MVPDIVKGSPDFLSHEIKNKVDTLKNKNNS